MDSKDIPISYSARFQQNEAVMSYEAHEYGRKSYATSIWHLQRPVLEQILREYRQRHPGPVRLLDFACGTGRVLSALEPLVDSADGVDISENMVAVARTRCVKARLRVGDVLSQPELLGKDYDIVSCFRFLLNVEPEMRERILRQLRQVLREPDGLLLVNVHGNSRSLRHPAILWRRWRERKTNPDVMLNEMSPESARKLLKNCGFEIVRQFGFGLLPATVYRTPLRGVAFAVDKALAGANGWRDWSIDMLFLCRPR